jgi:flagellar hook-associated protein 1
MGTALLSIGVRAMAASYAQMQTTSHNIANAGVAGYSRQTTMLATSQGQFTGVGFFGRGVDVVAVERSQDAFLVREAASSKALASMDAVRSDHLQQLELVFKSGEQGIGNSISQFFAAMSDMGSRPSDGATRQVVLARAQDLALRFNEAGKQLSQLQTNVNQELSASVATVNSLAASIAKVNNDIAAARGLGQQPNDLMDQRDQLISRLSEHVQVSTIAAEDGTVAVFMGGGQRLVLGNVAEKLAVIPDAFDTSRSAVAISEGASMRPLTREALGGGDIAGLLQFQDQDLVAGQSMLGQLARAVAGAVNAQQVLGLNLQPPAGTVASQPLFGLIESTKEQVLPAQTNLRDGSGAFTSDVSIEVVDPSQLKATEYELRGDPASAGDWLLYHVPDDGTMPVSVADGDQIDGFIVHFNAGPDVGERFRLQPVTRAATGLQRLLTNPLDLAAASPFVSSPGLANAGTAAVNALRMVSTPVDPTGSATITFTGPDGSDPTKMSYDWELRDSGGGVIDSGSGTWTPGQPIPSPPDLDINGFELDISGVPAAGDTLELSPTEYPATNNGNALSLAGLSTLNRVGLTALLDGSLSGGLSFNESFVAALANVGVRTQGAMSSATISAARASQAEASRSDKSGVNLDEEAARLIQYQQSYQAAAKVLQVAQQVFSDLLNIAG